MCFCLSKGEFTLTTTTKSFYRNQRRYSLIVLSICQPHLSQWMWLLPLRNPLQNPRVCGCHRRDLSFLGWRAASGAPCSLWCLVGHVERSYERYQITEMSSPKWTQAFWETWKRQSALAFGNLFWGAQPILRGTPLFVIRVHQHLAHPGDTLFGCTNSVLNTHRKSICQYE